MRLLTNGFLSRLTKTGSISRRTENITGKSPQLEWLRQVSSFETHELLDEFNTSRDGLSAEMVELSRAAWGSNEVTHVRRDSAPVRFAKAFVDHFTGILALLAVVSLFTDVILAAPADRNPSTFLIIFAMIAVSGILRFVQEGKSDNAAAALARTIQTTCNVERQDVGRIEIPLADVVVGDIVHLSAGDIVPADARLIQTRDLFLGMSSLTGESLPVERVAKACPAPAKDTRTAGDLDNIVLMGSTVVSGSGVAVVVATGANTMFGGMARSLGSVRGKTAYDEGIASVSKLLLRLMVVMAPLVFVINGITKGDWLSALLFSLSVAVGLTPEMLPMIVTTCLAKGAVDLSHDRVIVKRLDAIQNLGAMDVLCTDKTGTLTEDHVVLERHLDLMGNEDPRVLRYAFLNSFFETGVRNLIDSAIISRAADETARGAAGIDADDLAASWHLVDEVPFDFERRRVSVVVEHKDGRRRMVTKGAIEEVLQVCTEVEYNGRVVPLDDKMREKVLATAYDLADKGMRVLGVSCKANPGEVGVLSGKDEQGMTLIGYLAFLDPPKRSAAQAVAALRQHGAATKVLTGDSLRVACTVCETIGLHVEGTLDGAAVAQLSDEELENRVEHVTVFAKLSPNQKVRVVRALRANGHVVGFMGDGVNDAAAMGASDCGVSVDSGADVAKEAADIILLEKDLGVLERGIVEGRRTFFNMNKYVKMTASSNFGNIFSVLVASVFLPFLPMTAVQLLLLNFIYDCACTAIPWDNVDSRELRAPQTWRSGSIASFMRWIGPTSSVFDVVTFALLFFWVCPAVAGGSWSAIAGDPAAMALFAATFQACWFAESMCTQVFFVHLVRTERVPFVQSMADWRVLLLDAAAVVLSILIPFTTVGADLGMAPLPATFLVALPLIVAAYATLVMLARRAYIRRFGRLL